MDFLNILQNLLIGVIEIEVLITYGKIAPFLLESIEHGGRRGVGTLQRVVGTSAFINVSR